MSINPLHGARVQHGLSLHEIASSTRLSPRIVNALDSGRFEQLPAGIYARSYVRAFAVAVGLNPDDALTDLSEQLPRPVELVPALLDQARPPRPRVVPGGIVRAAAVDLALLFALSLLLLSVVAGYAACPCAGSSGSLPARWSGFARLFGSSTKCCSAGSAVSGSSGPAVPS